MASTIEAQVISGFGDQCIALAASQFGRPHGYGNNWNTLRVAILFAAEYAGGASLSGTVFRVGLCSGTANMPGDGTTDNSYGIKFQASWTAQTNGGHNGYAMHNGSTYPLAFTRVGVTETLSSNIGKYAFTGVVGGTRSALFIDIIKGSPNYTFNYFARGDLGNGFQDATPTQFLAQVGSLAPVLDYHTYSTAIAATGLPVDAGAHGPLDTVYVGWNLLTPRIFISNLAVVRLA